VRAYTGVTSHRRGEEVRYEIMKFSSVSAWNTLLASSINISYLNYRFCAVPLTAAYEWNIPHKPSSFRSTKLITTAMGSSTTTSNHSSITSELINCPKVTLNNGLSHPAIGYGTYKVGFIPASASAAAAGGGVGGTSSSAEECVANAIQCGYRFFECAQFYGNERQIGKAIAESGIPREEFFLCSKVWTTTMEQGADAIRAQVEQTLQDLRTDYLDLYLIHWPVPGHHVQAYKTLEELYLKGKFKGIGLSNYAVEDYQELKDNSISVIPVVNQIEINPFLYRKKTIEFFQNEGIVLQSYRSLRDGKAFQHPTLVHLAGKHQRTPAQILGRWCVQKGFIYVPKSTRKDRMIENAQVCDFSLSQEDMSELDKLTTPEALDTFLQLYRKCVNRDTSKDGTMDGVKMKITVD
jgi:diketogulonate reductase-like aldo/keto reductase